MTAVAVEKMTVAQYRQLEFDDNDTYIYELINGILVRKSAPQPKHQAISKRLLKALDDFVIEKGLGEFYYAPIDVFLDDFNAPQPDLVYVSKTGNAVFDENEGIFGIPDLMIEIISPGSVRKDRFDKKELYERFSVKEYWIVEPTNQSIEVYTLKGKKYELHNIFEKDSTITSVLLEGLEIGFDRIF